MLNYSTYQKWKWKQKWKGNGNRNGNEAQLVRNGKIDQLDRFK